MRNCTIIACTKCYLKTIEVVFEAELTTTIFLLIKWTILIKYETAAEFRFENSDEGVCELPTISRASSFMSFTKWNS